MSDGFYRCTFLEDSYVYKIIRCVTEHFHNHKIPVATYLMDLVMIADAPAGLHMDRVIQACCFYDLSSVSLPLCISQQETVPFTADIEINMLTSLDTNSEDG